MTFEFDDGSSSSTESSIGPFLNWHARETLDGVISSRRFSIRDEDGERTDVTDQFKKGVIFDIDSLATGWCWADGTPGQAPLWEMNETPAKFNPQPADRGDERWKKGFQIRVGLNKTDSALWSQSGSGAFEGLKSLMKSVKAASGDGEVVIAAMTDVEEIKYKKGGTSAPIFTVKKWTSRPDCLKDDAAEAPVVADEAEDEF